MLLHSLFYGPRHLLFFFTVYKLESYHVRVQYRLKKVWLLTLKKKATRARPASYCKSTKVLACLFGLRLALHVRANGTDRSTPRRGQLVCRRLEIWFYFTKMRPIFEILKLWINFEYFHGEQILRFPVFSGFCEHFWNSELFWEYDFFFEFLTYFEISTVFYSNYCLKSEQIFNFIFEHYLVNVNNFWNSEIFNEKLNKI